MATPQREPTPSLDVLLVEDNPADARLLRAQLEDADGAFSLRHVEGLQAAEAACRETRFDVCLLDLNLPDSSGVETVERFRRSVPDLPVVVLTGLQDTEAASAAIRTGADEYLVKGQITPRAVERTLRFAVERDRAHRERQAAEERWAVVFEASPVAKVLSDAGTGRLIEVNRAFVDMFGHSRRELLGSTSLELGQWEDVGRRAELVEKARSEGFFEGEEAWFRDADGRRGRMLLACRHLALSEGDRLLWTVQDITDRVEREQALEARSRALRERVKEQSCLYDVSRLLHEDGRPLTERLQAVVERLPAGWQHPDVTVARLQLNGDVHVAGAFEGGLPALEAVIEVDGEPVGELAVAYREERPEEDLGPFLAEERRLLDEIAGQIETEVSRQKTRREMGHVVETMNEAVTIAAPDGTVTFANTAARRLFSPGEGGYVGRDLTDFAPQVETLEGEPYPPEELPFQTVMRTGRPVTGFQHAIDRTDGDRIVVSVNAAPMREDGDEIQGVVLTVRDVTDRHRAAAWRHLLQSSVEAAAHGIVITDRSGEIVWANPAFTEITGYGREEVLGENPRILKSGEQDDAFYEDMWSTILAGETWRGELVNRRKDGSLYTERQSVVPVRHRGDEITHFVAVKEDISREKRREEELRQTTRRLHELLDTAAGIIFRVDLSELGVTYVTPNVASLTGHPVERWTEEPRFWMELVPDEDLERVLRTVAGAVRSGQRQAEEEYRIRHADGRLHWYRSIVRFEFDGNGEPVAFVGTSVDVTERRKLEGQLRHQALHDPLTGLANRHLLADRLDQAVGRARRHDEGMAVLILDVDRFKRINDSLGHTAGDRVLEEVARRLEESVRHEDTVARFGGDEFCLLLTELGSGDDLARVRDRLLDRLREPMEVTGQELSLDVTLGGVVFGSPRLPGAVSVEDPAELIRYADRALHRAKRRAGTSQHLYDPDSDGGEAGDPLERELDLRRGLEAGEFEPHYQPIVRLATGEIWGVEPLARWRHPERGLVGPDEFVGLAEETGLIHELGEQVLCRAIEDLGRWAEGPAVPSLRLTPNVSGRQFEEEGLPERLRAALEATEIEADRLLLEVTETSIMRATRRIDEIRDLGAGVMIDDFGTGYSSLLYLRDLHVDGLKIDMSFVQGLGRGEGNTAIVETVLTLGKAMGLAVIAEGIETSGQLRRLRQMGCDLGQGYLFARPVPADEMGALLAEGPLAAAGSG